MNSKIRYTRQYDRTTCGPTAILNALKWAGYNCSRKKYKKCLMKRSRCGKLGCWPVDIDRALHRTPELKISKVFYRPTLKMIDKYIDKGKVLIIRYIHINGHYTLCTGRTKKYYELINNSIEKTIDKVSRKTMSKMLKSTNHWISKEEYPWMDDAFGYSVVWCLDSV